MIKLVNDKKSVLLAKMSEEQQKVDKQNKKISIHNAIAFTIIIIISILLVLLSFIFYIAYTDWIKCSETIKPIFQMVLLFISIFMWFIIYSYYEDVVHRDHISISTLPGYEFLQEISEAEVLDIYIRKNDFDNYEVITVIKTQDNFVIRNKRPIVTKEKIGISESYIDVLEWVLYIPYNSNN